MTTLSTLRTEVRNRVKESTASFWTDAEINAWLNYAYRDFAKETEWFDKVKAYPIVANQFIYDLPSDIQFCDYLRWEDQKKIEPQDLEQFLRNMGFGGASGDPRDYCLNHPWDGKFRIYPIPSAASASTTVSGAHNTTVTTITVADASDFPTRGRAILNDSEQILYTGTTATTLTGVVRGDGYTTAASYSGSETVKYAPLELYYRYTPPDMTASIDFRGPDRYDEALVQYATALALRKDEKYQEASILMAAFDRNVKLAKAEKVRHLRDKHYAIKDEDAWEAGTY